MRRAASTAETPLTWSVTSAIGPMWKCAPPYIGPLPMKSPLATRTTRQSASTGRAASSARAERGVQSGAGADDAAALAGRQVRAVDRGEDRRQRPGGRRRQPQAQ